MSNFSRREFVGASVSIAAMVSVPHFATAAPSQCDAAAGLPAPLGNQLTVDCASRQNFKTFRQYSDYLGLAGVVSIRPVQSRYGSFNAGNLFLFPWLKPAGQDALKEGRASWSTVVPANATLYSSANPIPGATLPLDEYFCREVLQAPWTSFIGFQVDVPFKAAQARLAWFTNVDRLADGEGVGIDWTSVGLNELWFDGSRWIPSTDACGGAAWRQMIIDGLNKASTGVCHPGPT
jgi:hypothetical protein